MLYRLILELFVPMHDYRRLLARRLCSTNDADISGKLIDGARQHL